MIKAVLFDLDGTLLDRHRSIEKFITDQHHRFQNYLKDVPLGAYLSIFIDLEKNGLVWKDKVYRRMVEYFNIQELTWEILLRDYEGKFKNHCVPFPDLSTMLSTLKERGYFLGVVSNGRFDFQKSTMEGLGIKKVFQSVLISESEGIRKPDPEIFRRAAAAAGRLAAECVFIGDHPEVDILGAKAAGMRAIWKRNQVFGTSNDADLIIDGLSEIPDAVDRLIKIGAKHEKN